MRKQKLTVIIRHDDGEGNIKHLETSVDYDSSYYPAVGMAFDEFGRPMMDTLARNLHR